MATLKEMMDFHTEKQHTKYLPDAVPISRSLIDSFQFKGVQYLVVFDRDKNVFDLLTIHMGSVILFNTLPEVYAYIKETTNVT